MALHISETFVNATEGYQLGDGDEYETVYDDAGELYRSLVREYGRARKMYQETGNGDRQVGWVFEKRAKYTDSNETYLQETWVTVLDAKTDIQITRTPHYHQF